MIEGMWSIIDRAFRFRSLSINLEGFILCACSIVSSQDLIVISSTGQLARISTRADYSLDLESIIQPTVLTHYPHLSTATSIQYLPSISSLFIHTLSKTSAALLFVCPSCLRSSRVNTENPLIQDLFLDGSHHYAVHGFDITSRARLEIAIVVTTLGNSPNSPTKQQQSTLILLAAKQITQCMCTQDFKDDNNLTLSVEQVHSLPLGMNLSVDVSGRTSVGSSTREEEFVSIRFSKQSTVICVESTTRYLLIRKNRAGALGLAAELPKSPRIHSMSLTKTSPQRADSRKGSEVSSHKKENQSKLFQHLFGKPSDTTDRKSGAFARNEKSTMNSCLFPVEVGNECWLLHSLLDSERPRNPKNSTREAHSPQSGNQLAVQADLFLINSLGSELVDANQLGFGFVDIDPTSTRSQLYPFDIVSREANVVLLQMTPVPGLIFFTRSDGVIDVCTQPAAGHKSLIGSLRLDLRSCNLQSGVVDVGVNVTEVASLSLDQKEEIAQPVLLVHENSSETLSICMLEQIRPLSWIASQLQTRGRLAQAFALSQTIVSELEHSDAALYSKSNHDRSEFTSFHEQIVFQRAIKLLQSGEPHKQVNAFVQTHYPNISLQKAFELRNTVDLSWYTSTNLDAWASLIFQVWKRRQKVLQDSKSSNQETLAVLDTLLRSPKWIAPAREVILHCSLSAVELLKVLERSSGFDRNQQVELMVDVYDSRGEYLQALQVFSNARQSHGQLSTRMNEIHESYILRLAASRDSFNAFESGSILKACIESLKEKVNARELSTVRFNDFLIQMCDALHERALQTANILKQNQPDLLLSFLYGWLIHTNVISDLFGVDSSENDLTSEVQLQREDVVCCDNAFRLSLVHESDADSVEVESGFNTQRNRFGNSDNAEVGSTTNSILRQVVHEFIGEILKDIKSASEILILREQTWKPEDFLIRILDSCKDLYDIVWVLQILQQKYEQFRNARAFLLSKIGRYKEAFEVLLEPFMQSSDTKEISKALDEVEIHCKSVTKIHKPIALLELIQLCISLIPSHGLFLLERARQLVLEFEAAQLEHDEESHSTNNLDLLSILEEIPHGLSVHDVSCFIQTLYLVYQRRINISETKHMLMNSELKQINLQVQERSRQYSIIDNESKCESCDTKIGLSAFIRYPNGSIIHVACNTKA